MTIKYSNNVNNVNVLMNIIFVSDMHEFSYSFRQSRRL